MCKITHKANKHYQGKVSVAFRFSNRKLKYFYSIMAKTLLICNFVTNLLKFYDLNCTFL